MREKVYLNRVTVGYEMLYSRAKDYFHRHGVDIEFNFEQTDYKDLYYAKMQFPQGERIILQPHMSKILPIDISYDINSFVFNGQEFTPPTIPTGYCYYPTIAPFIDILTDS